MLIIPSVFLPLPLIEARSNSGYVDIMNVMSCGEERKLDLLQVFVLAFFQFLLLGSACVFLTFLMFLIFLMDCPLVLCISIAR